MTEAQRRIVNMLGEKEMTFRAYANSKSYTDGAMEETYKEYANECATAIRILKDVYKE